MRFKIAYALLVACLPFGAVVSADYGLKCSYNDFSGTDTVLEVAGESYIMEYAEKRNETDHRALKKVNETNEYYVYQFMPYYYLYNGEKHLMPAAKQKGIFVAVSRQGQHILHLTKDGDQTYQTVMDTNCKLLDTSERDTLFRTVKAKAAPFLYEPTKPKF